MKIKLKIDRKIMNKVYRPFMLCFTRIQIFFGGSSSGKSVFIAQRCVLDMMEGGRNYLIVRKVATTLKKSVFNQVNKVIKGFGLGKYFHVNNSDLVITCKHNGYQIIFAGLDDVEKLKSITPAKGVITDIWVEEATETDKKDLKQLRKRLRGLSKAKKRITISFNPILQSHWIYLEFFGNWDDTKNFYQDETLTILRTTYKDNKYLTPEDIAELENEEDPYYRDVYTYGKWGVLGAVIFKNWSVMDCSEIMKVADRFNNGLDFGYGGHPNALAHTYYDKKRKTIYVLPEEMYETGLTNDLIADKLKPIIGRQLIKADSAEPKSIQELINYHINVQPARKGKDSVHHGIQWLQKQKIIVDIRCQAAKNELGQYKWKEDKNGTILDEPVDKFNHFIDALRYAYEDEMLDTDSKVSAKMPSVHVNTWGSTSKWDI